MTQLALRSGSTLITGGERHDKELGAQLTEQYHRATGGMREVLKFGCMMMMLRTHLVSTLDTTRPTRGPTAKDTGIKAWIEEHAPTVQRSTAYRFEDVAKAVQQAYQLPSRVAKRLSFEQVVTADPKTLDEAARKAQQEVNDYVSGTSQKSWLDQFHDATRGGDTSAHRKKLTPEEEHAAFLEMAKTDFCAAFEILDRVQEKQLWKAPSVSDALLQAGVDSASEFVKQARAWLKTPKRQRSAPDWEEAA